MAGCGTYSDDVRIGEVETQNVHLEKLVRLHVVYNARDGGTIVAADKRLTGGGNGGVVQRWLRDTFSVLARR